MCGQSALSLERRTAFGTHSRKQINTAIGCTLLNNALATPPRHGVSIEILAPDRALLFWYVYDENGTPMPLYMDGVIRGREIRGTAYNPSGMRFGSFDPADHTLPVWGEISIDSDGSVWAVETLGGPDDVVLGPTNVGLPQHALVTT